jgi:hypothetical protein
VRVSFNVCELLCECKCECVVSEHEWKCGSVCGLKVSV